MRRRSFPGGRRMSPISSSRPSAVGLLEEPLLRSASVNAHARVQQFTLSNCSGSATQLTARTGASALADEMDHRATRSLPVPLSPCRHGGGVALRDPGSRFQLRHGPTDTDQIIQRRTVRRSLKTVDILRSAGSPAPCGWSASALPCRTLADIVLRASFMARTATLRRRAPSS